ncbi:putative ABC transporter (plasmid) [Sinorhizobium fredii HH103]|uniref:ABC transporter n=2 Tax=Rhizobium fredii TaxID=380 RepID=G9AEH9_SINF1|nr:putative ABC transporter [Sinorhizobium fredii HH103]
MTLKTFGFDQFGFLLFSLQWTLLLTVIALIGGGLLGFAVALARTAQLKAVRIAAASYIQIIQGIPVLMILFLSYYGLSLAGFELPPLIAAGASMTIYASGYLAEIWRGCIQAVPKQQWEASESLAMTRLQQYRYVILPQAMRISLRRSSRSASSWWWPPSISSSVIHCPSCRACWKGGFMPEVVVENVHKSFGALEVLKGVSLTVGRGEVFALIGRSGSGKSTLLRCMNGLEKVNSGRIEIAGHALGEDAKALRKLRTDVGIVFQSYNLFPHLTVGENIMLAPRIVKDVAKTKAKEVAREVLQLVGLSEKFDSYPDQLSGGQQQRVAIARSLAMRPKVMLFDEVTSALDPELTEEVLTVMENLARDGMTMILVTHEMGFARRVATQTIFMHKGKIWEQGPSASLFADPETPELRQFVKSDVK